VFAKVIPLGERHLRKLVSEFVEHYHTERNHQGRRNKLVCRRTTMPPTAAASCVVNASVAC